MIITVMITTMEPLPIMVLGIQPMLPDIMELVMQTEEISTEKAGSAKELKADSAKVLRADSAKVLRADSARGQKGAL